MRVSPEWTSADPEMVTVTPSHGNEVKIMVGRAGQTTLHVISNGVSRELTIRAARQDDTLRVDIVQE